MWSDVGVIQWKTVECGRHVVVEFDFTTRERRLFTWPGYRMAPSALRASRLAGVLHLSGWQTTAARSLVGDQLISQLYLPVFVLCILLRIGNSFVHVEVDVSFHFHFIFKTNFANDVEIDILSFTFSCL